jgi:peptide/nickel transport system substrate-binding protein
VRTHRWKMQVVVVALVIGLAVTLLTGPGFSQAKRGGLITFALYQEPELLNPYIATQTASFEVLKFAVEGLLGVNENGEYYPLLAKEVPTRQNNGISADGKTITYQLKDDLKWSDGRALTCGDVQFTLQAIMHPRSGAVSTAGYRDMQTVECPTPATVVVKYKTFYAPFLSLFDYVLPRHATGDPADMTRWAYNRRVVGTGPFTMLEWVSGDHITFIQNRYYRDAGKPYLNGVIIRIVPSREVGKQLIRTGEVDVVWDLVEADVPEVRGYPGAKVSVTPGPSAERLVFNLADPTLDGPTPETIANRPHPILGDPRVREAIELGINKKEIIDKLLFGLAPIGTNELHIGWAKCVSRAAEYAPDRARQLLDQAGWRPGGDGIRVSQGVRTTRDGTRLRLKYQTTTGNRLREQVQQLMIDYMKQIGVEFFIENVPSPVLFASWAGGGFRKHGQFDVLMYTTNPDVDPQSQVEGYFASWSMPTAANSGAGFNYSRWANKVFDDNIKVAGSNPDLNVRKRAYCAAMGELVKDRPHVYLYARSEIHAYRERLQGWVGNSWARLGWNSADWWVR